MSNIEIIKVKPDQADQLQKIGRQTFYETFAAENTEENMSKYLNEGFSIDKLATELKNKDSAFYFAMHDNDVIGYLKLNSAQSQTEMQNSEALEIERIYVLKDFHRKKVGQTLYQKAIQVARQMKAPYIWLGVWEKNERAISFYRRNGFAEFDKHIFRLGNEEQTDILMKLVLNNR